MKNILSICNPINACYPIISQTSGILFADPLIHDWLMNNFIQIFEVDQETHAVDYYDYSAEGNPFLSYNEIDFSFISRNWSDLSDFIKCAIDDNYYIRIFVDMKEVAAYPVEYESYHDLMVYGYDDVDKIFYIADHFNGGEFLMKKCSFDEMNRATYCFEPEQRFKEAYLSSVQMIKKECDFMRLRYSMYSPEQMDYIMTFNTNIIYQSLLSYLEGKPVIGWFTRGRIMDDNLEKTHRWGIDCYEVLMESITKIEQNGKEGPFEKQSFHVLANHKTVMIERIKTLAERYEEIDWNTHISNYEKLEKMLKEATLVFMKCQLFKRHENEKHKEVCMRLKDIIIKAKKIDYEITKKLLDELYPIRRNV